MISMFYLNNFSCNHNETKNNDNNNYIYLHSFLVAKVCTETVYGDAHL